MKLVRALCVVLLGCIMSGYFFPFRLFIFPPSLNTKQIIGVVGILAFLVKCVKEKSVQVSKSVFVSAILAVIFSLWCFFCVVINNTDDMSYAEYFVSFAVWLGGAFGVCSLIKVLHGRMDIRLLTNYLAGVCVVQCILAMMIDSVPVVQIFVDTYIDQAQDFLKDIGRLYGIGCALDPAGVRFAAVLVLIARQLVVDSSEKERTYSLNIYLICFIFISVIGNMISRTTTVGMALGLGYMIFSIGLPRAGIIKRYQVSFYKCFITLLLASTVVCVWLNATNSTFNKNFNFAFEGFINLFQNGKFQTDSTDLLNTLWLLPEDMNGWLVGYGHFGTFYYHTDIGYCRFTLYCGLVGLSLFSLFFIYNGISVYKKFKKFEFFTVILISLTFIIWLKVATDIFLINALLFCIDGDYDEDGNETGMYDSLAMKEV